MMRLCIAVIFCTMGWVACKNVDKNATQFGEEFDIAGAISYDDLLTKINGTEPIQAKVKGKVSGVCQAKGCWMTIVSDTPDKEEMFVKFKDYGFFVPKDISGKTVVMEGEAYREVTSVEDLKHYAEDEEKSQEEIDAITEPLEELKFMATGVAIVEN